MEARLRELDEAVPGGMAEAAGCWGCLSLGLLSAVLLGEMTAGWWMVGW